MAEAINRQIINFDVLDQAKQYEEQYVHQIGDDDYHLGLYPEIDPPAASTAPETLADANCIYVSNTTGNDTTGDGSTATPYKTINKAITIFFAQATRVKKYICLKDTYTYVENIQIPKWLEDNIFSNGSDDPRIRRIERGIPYKRSVHAGTANLSGGYNFAAANKSFVINVNGAGDQTITLTANCANATAIVTHLNNLLNAAGYTNIIESFTNTIYIYIRFSTNYTCIGGDNFIIAAGGTALAVLGWTAATYSNTLTDTNTYWVNVNSAIGSDAAAGTRAAPFLTVNKAITSNIAGTKEYIAVKVDDTYYTSTENIFGYNLPESIMIFPYMSDDNIEIKCGKSLKLQYNTLDILKYKNSLFEATKYKQQYLITKNETDAPNATYGEILYIVNKATDAYAIQYTYDFVNKNDIASLTSKNWTGIGKYYYSGHWYLIICADDGGSNMRIFYYKLIDATKNEYQIATTGVASTTAGHYIVSDGNNAFMVCYTASGSYIYKCINNANITSNASWSLLYSGTGTIYMTLCDDGNFYFCESGVNKVFKYNKSTTSYDTYDLGAYSFVSIFYFNGYLYGIFYDTVSTYNKIYKLDLISLTIAEICNVGDATGIFKSIFIEHEAIYILIHNTAIKDTIYNFDGNNIYIYQSNIYNASISTYQVLGQYQKFFNGQFILSATNAQGIGYINSGIVSLFGNTNYIKNIEINKIQSIKFDTIYNNKIYNGIISTAFIINYCNFNNLNIGFQNNNPVHSMYVISPTPFIDAYNLFTNCDYPIIIQNENPQLYISHIYNIFYNFKIAISHYIKPKMNNFATDYAITHNIAINGDIFYKFFKTLQRYTAYNRFDYNILDKISAFVLYDDDTSAFTFINNLIYPHAIGIMDDGSNTGLASSNNIYGIPLYYNFDNYDFRLQNNKCLASNGEYYKYTSKGVALDTTNTSTPTGKDYNWVAYTAQSTDYGCFTVLTPLYKNETWESLTPTITPKDLSINKKQDKTQIQTTLDDITYKTTPLMKRAINISFSETPLLQEILLNTQKIDRLMEQTDAFKFMPNPLKTEHSTSNIEQLTYASSGAYTGSAMYGYISNGQVGFESGVFTITSMVLNLNKTIEKGLYNKLFVIIYKEPGSYPGDLVKWEYRISNTTKAGLLTLEDYFDIGDIANGTYACVIAYALVLHDTNELQNKANVYAGLNYTDHSVMSGQTIQLIEV